MTYGHLQADCLYTGISSGPKARYRVWEAFTFYLFTSSVGQEKERMWCFDAVFLTVKVCLMTAVNKYREALDRSPRLLSVQMNQTPACMRGPASISRNESDPGLYARPSVYHNMSTLCCFIQKSSTSVYQYQYFVYFHSALKH